MGSPEKPLDVEMGDMSEESKLNPSDVEVKTEQGLLKEEEKEPRFTGLKKEELLAISNQPKWVRARWALFIIFWIVWIAMLVGAILIVVNAPRCKEEPSPQWYQDTVAYAAEVEDFAEDFTGMKDHLPYVKALNSKTLLIGGAAQSSDASAVMGDEKKFKMLVESAHSEDMKVMVDVVVDSLSKESSEFVSSSQPSCKGQSTDKCGMFIWKSGITAGSDGWATSSTRNESFMVNSRGDPLVDYSNPLAYQYIKNVFSAWFDRSVDGIYIRDVGKIEGKSAQEFVMEIWNEHFMINSSDSDDKIRALYVFSSSPNATITPEPLGANDTNTEHSPVFFNYELASCVGNGSGMSIKEKVMDWRRQSRSIGGYGISPTSDRLAAERHDPKLAAALSLLTSALPGVPILRSGDELAVTSPKFTWTSGDLRDSVPVNGSSDVLKATRELTVRRMDGIQAMPSLRFDTRNADTKFGFLEIGNEDVVAFRRKWDKKAAVLVVGNMSPTTHTVNVVVKNGLEKKEEELAEKAKILISSDSAKTSSDVDLKALEIKAKTTLILVL